MKLKKIFSKCVNGVINSVAQTSNSEDLQDYRVDDEIKAVCRKSAAEGMVLLKNDGALPLDKKSVLAVFGRVQSDSFYVGYGSGGDVNAPYKISFVDGLKNSGISIDMQLFNEYERWRAKNPVDDGFWGHWPMSYDEMPLEAETVEQSALRSDAALVFIGRAAGEDRENRLEKGSFYLNDIEENMLRLVSENFKKWTVILNIGGVFDFSWVKKYSPSAILISWLGGMEQGNACADILTGAVNPSGALTDTIAESYECYPSADNFGARAENVYKEDIFVGYRYFETFEKEKVLFPFGFGLSYTDFSVGGFEFSRDGDSLLISALITNSGKCSGKKTAELYFSVDGSFLSHPARQLAAFAKTKLLSPGEAQRISFKLPYYSLAAYDDSGASGCKNAYILDKGRYTFYLGFDVRSAPEAGAFVLEKAEIIERLEEIASVQPEKAFERLTARCENGRYIKSYEPAPVRTAKLREIILKRLPEEMPAKPCTVSEVESGAASLNELAASLSLTELEAISRGDYIMNSPLGPKGNAGVFGGVLDSIRKKGISPVVCTDGPSGIDRKSVV